MRQLEKTKRRNLNQNTLELVRAVWLMEGWWWFPRNHTSVKRFWTKSSGRVLTKPAPHSLVNDCCNCRSMFSLRMADFNNSFSTSKAAICLRLSVGLEARSEKKRGNILSKNVLEKLCVILIANVLTSVSIPFPPYLCTQPQSRT